MVVELHAAGITSREKRVSIPRVSRWVRGARQRLRRAHACFAGGGGGYARRSPNSGPQGLTRRRVAVSLLLPALLVVLGLPSTVQAQSFSWSTTLTVDISGSFSGCDNNDPGQDDCSTALADDDFVFGGATYEIQELYFNSLTNSVTVKWNTYPSADLRKLTLHVGTLALDLANPSSSVQGTGQMVFGATNPGWTQSQQVAVSLKPAEVGRCRFPDKTPPTSPTLSTGTAAATSVSLTWTSAAHSADSGGITDYIVLIYKGGEYQFQKSFPPTGSPWGLAPGTVPSTTYTKTVDGLTASTEYEARVRVRTVLGCYSARSGGFAFTTTSGSGQQGPQIGRISRPADDPGDSGAEPQRAGQAAQQPERSEPAQQETAEPRPQPERSEPAQQETAEPRPQPEPQSEPDPQQPEATGEPWRAPDTDNSGCIDAGEFLTVVYDYAAAKISTPTVLAVAANRC